MEQSWKHCTSTSNKQTPSLNGKYATVWNCLTEDIVTSTSVNLFKKKTAKIEKYTDGVGTSWTDVCNPSFRWVQQLLVSNLESLHAGLISQVTVATLTHTNKSLVLMEKSVYITSFSAVRGTVSSSLDAMNRQTQPSSCSRDFLVWTDVRTRSRRFTDNGNTSSSWCCSSQTYK